MRKQEIICTDSSKPDMLFFRDLLETEIQSSIAKNPYEVRKTIFVRNEPMDGYSLFISLKDLENKQSFYYPMNYFLHELTRVTKRRYIVQVIETNHSYQSLNYTRFGFVKVNFLQNDTF